MRKKFYINSIVSGSLLFICSAFAYGSSPAPLVLYCPAPQSININYAQNKASAPGGWIGSNIGLSSKNKFDWQRLVLNIDYERRGRCTYEIFTDDSLKLLKLHDTVFPKNYNLYDRIGRNVPTYACVDTLNQGPPIDDSCYYSSHSY